jgi:RNA polymerase sigma factor (sigma-70 family)
MARTVGLPQHDLPDAAEGVALCPRSGDGATTASQSTVVGLFKAQAKRVRSFLRRRLRSDEDAQDATQEVFLRLWRREKEGALEADANSYMITSVYNVAVDVERWRAYHRPNERVAIEDTDIASRDAEASEALFWRDALHQFVDTLNELPDVTQQVFALHHVEGLTHVAIAKRLGMAVRSVERHMARAIAHCEERMKDYLG